MAGRTHTKVVRAAFVMIATGSALRHVLALSTRVAQAPSSITQPLNGASAAEKTIIEPGQPFRDTSPGELSVASYNVLSPTLHALSHPLEVREEHEMNDRQKRVPVALKIAKQLNADVLCLQEVDGGKEHLEALEELLSAPELVNGKLLEGYDSCVWSPLHPNRKGDVVGLCVAWRSSRHELVSRHRFRRGLVVHLEEKDGGATFSVANLHLPARPNDIYGRLSSVATACRRIEDNRVSSSSVSPLDGAAIMVGDFNCNTDSSAIQLLKNGLVSPGMLFERNYRHKLTKTHAYKLRHGLKFLDAYGGSIRKSVASVTVSLHGRGPGSMDHVLFMPGRWGKTRKRKDRRVLGKEDQVLAMALGGRRSRRRRRVQERKATRVESKPTALLRAEAVIATIDPDDAERTRLITSGLPRLEFGFPSDHLPVGVLLSPKKVREPPNCNGVNGEHKEDTASAVIPTGVVNRGDAHKTRQRHNALVRAVTRWLRQRGAIEFIKDEPLYRWKWVEGLEYVKKKMRAPDVCCVVPAENDSYSLTGGTLLMVELTVASRPTAVRKQKRKKYQDLSLTLQSSPAVREEKLSVPSPFVIVITENGEIPLDTLKTLESLAQLTNNKGNSHNNSAASLSEELIRIRNHWTAPPDGEEF